MSSDGITEDVRHLINAHIASIAQLEVLLLLFRNQAREWDAAGVNNELYLTPESVESWLAALCSSGLVVCRNEPTPLYQYKASTPGLDRAVHNLAQAYSERRVAIINLIFAKPPDHITSFSDAFKFKKDGK